VSPIYDDDLERAEQRKGLGKPRPRGTLPRLPRGRDIELLRDWLTRAFNPPEGYRFDTFDRTTKQKSDPCSITFRNGRDTRTFRFGTQGDLVGSKLRSMVFAVGDGDLDMPHLTGSEIEDVWAALCKAGRVVVEIDDREETTKWLQQLLDSSSPLRGKTLVPDGRHDALMAIKSQGEFTRPDALSLVRGGEQWQRRPIRFVDEQTGEQWLRAGEAAAFVRWVCGVEPLSYSTLRGRLSEIGVEVKRFEDYHPPHPKLTLYRLTAELVEYVDGEGGKGQGGGVESAGGVNQRGERMEF
jgi:hypothetical protein